MISRILSRTRAARRRSLVELAYSLAWRLGLRAAAPTTAQRAIFTRVHDANEWGDPESRSGPGSTVARGATLHAALAGLIARHGVRNLLDAPCGDFNWMRHITPQLGVSYIGVDIVNAVIAQNEKLYADARHQFLCLDMTRDPLPRADLVLCRDALIHLSFTDAWAAIENIRMSGARLLLATTFIDAQNVDTRTGGWRPLNLQSAPFSFPEPIEMIEDLPLGGVAPGKRLALWELAAIPQRLSGGPAR